MLNWDDYNESEKIQKPQQIKEAQPVSTEQKVETAEENISEYSPVEQEKEQNKLKKLSINSIQNRVKKNWKD